MIQTEGEQPLQFQNSNALPRDEQGLLAPALPAPVATEEGMIQTAPADSPIIDVATSIIFGKRGLIFSSNDVRQFPRLEAPESKTARIKEQLKKDVIGQDHALEVVARHIAAIQKGLHNGKRPLGAILELGPSGVGKTETAIAAAKILLGEAWQTRFRRINCGEYAEPFNAQRLLGSPPGYVGEEETPPIPHDWLHAGLSVIVFDELEKAHPDTRQILLSMLDDGTFDSRKGKEGMKPLFFNRSLIFFTSNVGAFDMTRRSAGFRTNASLDNQQREIEAKALAAARREFAPELLTRMTDKVVFRSLQAEHLPAIFNKFINEINNRYEETLPFPPHFTATEEFKMYVLSQVDLREGARSLQHVLDRELVHKSVDIIGDDIRIPFIVVDYDAEEDAVNFYSMPLSN